ncbi:TAM domain methyltransferase, putative [Cordyceps militaris CM01]|uniref:TAM domain methyltransferase, putative n=1 Tax=Cordyceps militaris (strain CM01) TaxID=983644 RepID=G3JG11_CORMM|nr:TAM domain methyltransferase, putative [Cordyceps militaris CM01]EGX93629.1 TAM domain methyltransferase, putative [Cordyceps militaris CM01]
MSGSNSPSQGKGSGQNNSRDFSQYEFSFNYSLPSAEIEPDPAMDDIVGSSWSLSESIRNFPTEFGRTYHAYKAGSYAFPNDTIEQERLLLQFNAMTRLFGGKLYFAPLSAQNPPRLVLDIATGTGDWAIQMGDEFPQAQIVATDLSPIQPEDVPPNVSFFVEDSSEPWEYSESYDYIHTRVTSGCWSSFEEQIAKQAFENLQPGGWFESQEYDSIITSDDGTLSPDSALARWFHELATAGDLCDRPTVMAHKLREVYERVGFVDVQERIFKMPTNAWPKDEKLKEIGCMWERNFMSGLAGFSFRMFNKAFSRTPEEIEVALVDVRREFSDPRIHAYLPIWVVWGRKPHPNE